MSDAINWWFWAISFSLLLTALPISLSGAMRSIVQRLSIASAASAVIISAYLIADVAGGLAMALSLWHFVSTLRFEKRRHKPDELRRRVRVTTWWLSPMILGSAWLLMNGNELSHDGIERGAIALLSVALSVVGLLLLTTLWNFQTRRVRHSPTLNSDSPTVTLAIPARNETYALSESLQTALASDYAKLEILVLDDCSQDSTSEIIKGLAHNGVRFIQGTEPADGWLGKNRAYRLLAKEASGDIIIFSGVDIHFKPESISRLISYIEHTNLDMVSIMPSRRAFDPAANFLQPVRYMMQIAVPKALFGNEPVLDACWTIRRSALSKLGGMNAVKGAVIPAQYFANSLAVIHKYNFVIVTDWLGITTRKRLSSQIETATRTLYPKMKQELGLVLPAVTVSISLYVVPYILAIAGVVQAIDSPAVVLLSTVIALTLSAINFLIGWRLNPKSSVLYLLNLPFIVLAYSFMSVWSMLMYEFGEVNWKGRNVCIPVLNAKVPRKQRSN